MIFLNLNCTSEPDFIYFQQSVSSEAELRKVLDEITIRVDAIVNPTPKPSLATLGHSISALGKPVHHFSFWAVTFPIHMMITMMYIICSVLLVKTVLVL